MWINVQPQALFPTDLDDVARFDGAVVICDWPDRMADAIAILAAARVPIQLWRFTQNPTALPGWPGVLRDVCDLAVFANEPDLTDQADARPPWQRAAQDAWKAAGGRVAEPAWLDESTYRSYGEQYDVVTAHCYAGDWSNLQAVRKRAGSQPVIVTEYARAHAMERCAIDVDEAGVKEPVALFAYRWDGHQNAGYDLAGVMLDEPQEGRAPGVLGSPERGKPVDAPFVYSYPELDQGPTKLCWAYSVDATFDAVGRHVDAKDLYEQVMHQPFSPPGQAAIFAELKAAVDTAAAITHTTVTYLGGHGIINDFPTLLQAAKDGHWNIILGVQNADLISGQNYGHYILCRQMVWDEHGVPGEIVLDTFAREDGSSESYTWGQLEQAIRDNWDPSAAALAYQLAPQ